MPVINVEFTNTPEEMKAFKYNEIEVKMTAEAQDQGIYWAEAVIKVPHLLSLAPDKELAEARALLGILKQGAKRQKRIKLFAQNNVYPDTYKIIATLFIYDEEGAVVERKDYYNEIKCNDSNAQIL